MPETAAFRPVTLGDEPPLDHPVRSTAQQYSYEILLGFAVEPNTHSDQSATRDTLVIIGVYKGVRFCICLAEKLWAGSLEASGYEYLFNMRVIKK